jgi:phospholipase/carboxylesterase
MISARSSSVRILSQLVLGGALLAQASSLRADESETFRIYEQNWQKAEKAYAAQDYERAATHYSKVAEVLPFEPTTRFQLACCYARLGKIDRSLSSLNEAVRFGWEDVSRLEQIDDLKVLRAKPQFRRILRDAVAARDQNLLFYVGKSVDPAKPAPLLVVLQGLGGFRADIPYWEAAADETGCVLVAPRAVTRAGPMIEGWHRPGARDSSARDYFDLPAAAKRVDEAIAEAARRFKIDASRLVLAGFSQGAGVALHLIGRRADRYCGLVAVGGLYQPPGVAYWQSILAQHPIRVYVIAGKLDRLLPRSRQVVAELQAAHVPHRYDELDRLGHEFPLDYPKRLRAAIEFVLGERRRDRPPPARPM